MTAQEKLEMIEDMLSQGKTVYISSYTKTWKVTPKTIKRFAKVGIEFFKVSGNNLWMAQGRKRVCIDYCAIRTV